MSEGAYKWPKDMSAGCPFDDAEPADGTHYRVVYNNPTDESSFFRTKDDPNQNKMRDKFKNGTLSKQEKCKVYATSHHESYESSINFIRRYRAKCLWYVLPKLH